MSGGMRQGMQAIQVMGEGIMVLVIMDTVVFSIGLAL